jgi:type II secretory pathway component PulF
VKAAAASAAVSKGAGAHAGAPAPLPLSASSAAAVISGFGSAMSRSEMANFIRELSTAIMAGLPLVQALRTLARQGRSPRQHAMLSQIIEQVEHGRSLGDAAASWGKPFNDMTINMIRAGEASGKLGEVLKQAADLLDRDVKLRRALLSATMYPMILASLITIAVIVIVTVIVPKLLAGLPNHNMELPLPTRIVQGVAQFFGGYWWLIIPGVAVTVLAISRTYRTPGPRLWIDSRMLSLPLLGPLLRDVAVARFTRTLGTLTSAGIPILQALRITRGTLGNKGMERVIDEVCEQVSAGKTIADPMERSGYFPPMLVQIVNLGERSGRLDEMLTQAADAFEDKTESSVKIFTTALPPVLVVMLACVVGFVVLSIMLPLLQFQENLK